jgi:hypothetical protein
MDYTTATRAVYEKIADWINNDEELSEIFTATVMDVQTGSTNKYYVRLATQWGCGLYYGAQASSNSYTYRSLGYSLMQSGGSYADQLKVSNNAVDISNLRLMVIKSDYGIITDFFDTTISTDKQICMLLTTGTDNGDAKVKMGFAPYSTSATRYVQNATALSGNYSLKTRSNSARTGLTTYMVEASDVICEDAKICDGALINNQAFFEVDGQTWCSIRANDSYVGLALRIE